VKGQGRTSTTPGGSATPPEPDLPPLWGEQTELAIANFPISGEPMSLAVIHAIALIKVAAARVNVNAGVIEQGVGEAVASAADDVAAGGYDDQFPVDVFQTGSGTSSNMNVNEVVATLAQRRLGRAVHPNDDVNASQSSNDVVPSAIRVAAATTVGGRLLPAVGHAADVFEAAARRFADAVKPGRTHLMDAVPVTLGQEMGGYARQLRLADERLRSCLPRVCELPLGGTAVGTGLNTPPGFAADVVARLAALTGLPLTPAVDRFEAQSSQDCLVELSGQLRGLAVSLAKICDDLRWMASGPSAGLAEIRLPVLQAGSSIMPGKVNPVVPEAVAMVCAQVIGNDATVAWAGARGSFELNVMQPVIARNVLESVDLLAAAISLLADRAVAGITVDASALRASAERTSVVATALNRYLGYDVVATLVKQAEREQRSVRDVVIAAGFVDDGTITEGQLDTALDVHRMARGDG
jgi:fumarate hydratase class II